MRVAPKQLGTLGSASPQEAGIEAGVPDVVGVGEPAEEPLEPQPVAPVGSRAVHALQEANNSITLCYNIL